MKKRNIALAGLVIVVLGSIWISIRLNLWGVKQNPEFSGTIEGTMLPVQPEQSGKITALFVYEGQDLKTGQIIAQFDNRLAQIALDTANSQVQQAEFKLNDLLSGTRTEEVRRLQALLSQTRANAEGIAKNLQFEKNNLADDNQLYVTGAIGKKELSAEQNKVDNLNVQYDSAKDQIDAAQASLDQALAGYTEPTIQAQRVAVEISRESVKSAELALDKLEIKSPINGRVFYKYVELGQVVNAGTRLVTLLASADLSVKIYVPEAQINRFKVGGLALISVDAYPNKQFKGEVQYVSDVAEFTPKNVQTREERTSMVFAVKIRITEGRDLLKAGMPADVIYQ